MFLRKMVNAISQIKAARKNPNAFPNPFGILKVLTKKFPKIS